MWVYQKTDKGYEVGYFAPSGEGRLFTLSRTKEERFARLFERLDGLVADARNDEDIEGGWFADLYDYLSEAGQEYLWYLDEIFPGAVSARRRVHYLNGGGSS